MIQHSSRAIFVSLLLCVFALSSCSTDTPSDNKTYTVKKMNFTAGSSHYFNLFLVDTADGNGNNGDKIIADSAQYNRQELTIDTALTYKGFSNVTRMIFASDLPDTNYYYQDASGNVWRYNYGFNILNKFQSLVIALGGPVDVGWVLAAKPGAPAGTTWVAKSDSSTIPSFGVKVYLTDNATVMNDTVIAVSTDNITTQHIRHVVVASGAGTNGTVIVDTYVSAEVGTTVEDFFHHATISGLLANLQARGSQKIMVQK